MEYREFPPVPALAPVVERLWTLDGQGADLDGDPQPILPDGRPELVLHFGEAFERRTPAGTFERQAAGLFAGQLTGQLVLRPTGRIRVLGVRFHPHGASAVLRLPQRDLVGLTPGLEDLSTPLASIAQRILDNAKTLSDAAAMVQRALCRVMDRSRLDPRVAYVVGAIGRQHGRVSIDRLAHTAGLTRRHLERRFQQQVGVPPKRLARIARFQRALRVLEQADGAGRGALTAAACGFADQAHFIRDFRDLSGCSPTEYLMNTGTLTGFFTSSE